MVENRFGGTKGMTLLHKMYAAKSDSTLGVSWIGVGNCDCFYNKNKYPNFVAVGLTDCNLQVGHGRCLDCFKLRPQQVRNAVCGLCMLSDAQ